MTDSEWLHTWIGSSDRDRITVAVRRRGRRHRRTVLGELVLVGLGVGPQEQGREADDRHQGHGYGSQTVRLIAELVRAEGATELLTSYVPEDGGPEEFYRRLGFVPTGELDVNGEIIVRLAIA